MFLIATKEEELYRERVDNLSQPSHMLGVMCQKFNDTQLAGFRASRFGHLESVDRLTISGQLVHKFIFLRIGVVGESIKGKDKNGKGKVNTVPKKGSKNVSMTCVELEKAFKECENEDDASKMRLIYFTKGVLIRAESNVVVDLDYFELVDDMDMRGRGRGRVDSDVEIDEEKEKAREVRGDKDPDKAAKGLPLRYCKMTDPSTIPRILQWSTTKKQLIHEQL
ncbi:hypothetical protein DVH24_015674 [Malus domestica]|uniref:DUF1985 domain-containing protein n=1 Tax=Malus domestica TaxID=3750 RepID=A0A498HMB3_MALDO|nr:hypothetical protein DVH24_015674 [Malus domestica]